MTMTAIGRTISFVCVCVLLGVFVSALFRTAPAEARCVTSKCAAETRKSADDSQGKTGRVAQRSHHRHAHRIAKRHRIDPDQANAASDVKSLPVRVADARAEMMPGGSASDATAAAPSAAQASAEAKEPSPAIEIVNSDELNDLDRAATTKALPAAFANAHAEMRDDQSSPWRQTSLIGKAFIVIGVMLTLASAARMLMA